MINKAFEESNNDKLYQRWIAGYDKEMNYDEFKNKVTEIPKSQRVDITLTEGEIMEDVESILEQFRR